MKLMIQDGLLSMNEPQPSFEMVRWNSHRADSDKDHREHQPHAAGTQRRKQGFLLWMEMLRGDASGRGGFLTLAAFVGFQQCVNNPANTSGFQVSKLPEISSCTCVENDALSAPPFKIFLLSNLNVHWQRSGLKRCGTHTMECYSAIKKEWNKAICSNMDGPRECSSKVSQRRRNIIWHPLYVASKKKWYK